jgi:hypothetical protein
MKSLAMSNSAPPPSPSQILASQRFLQGRGAPLFSSDLTRSPTWYSFAQSWDDLRQDEYMADGGKYRLRRYSEFELDPGTRALSVLAHKPYRQSKEDNYLNGGIDRLYVPMREDAQANTSFRDVLFGCADVLAPLHPGSCWLVQVFQNRIIATSDEAGKPTPEGVHRDGVDYVLTLLIGRHNVTGGMSSTYAQDGTTLLASVTLAEAGDFIFLDDNRTRHAVQSIRNAEASEGGHRDALIAMFTRRAAVAADPT